jgi:23S rRNA (cytidine1920-2'-O)/16S rRNA (cytidine1409-2'-O)-methyltransferase
MTRKRLDVLVTERGLCESREKAQRLILAGSVLVDGHPSTKAGVRVDEDCRIELKERPRFVSRGGEKLEGAFEAFGPDVQGRICIDIGASTGGFTDCLLQHGAARVYAVDVGKGQLHWQLRNDPRVVVIEGINARYLDASMLPAEVPSFATIDVSFISLTKILPAAIQVLAPDAYIVALIKPQFEAGRSEVGKGGVVRDPAVRAAVIDRVHAFCEALGLHWHAVTESPITGPAGNVEYLAFLSRRSPDGSARPDRQDEGVLA